MEFRSGPAITCRRSCTSSGGSINTGNQKARRRGIDMQTLDLIILFAYLIGTVLFGSWFSRRHRQGMKEYFVSGKRMPWWVIMASIVSTETSSATFVTVPGLAYLGNFTF